MLDDYLIVSEKILPPYFKKVIKARNLIESKKAKTVSQAVKAVGISRSTYYKYKDFIFKPSKEHGRRFTIALILDDVPGILLEILNFVKEFKTSIVTINQDIPINNTAVVTMTLDGEEMTDSVDKFLDSLLTLKHVNKVSLMALE